METRYDYDTDSHTNKVKAGKNFTHIFFSCGLPLAIVFFPELVKLHDAGNNVAMFLLAVGLWAVGTAVFMLLIAKPIRKKVYGVRSQDFRLQTIILLSVAAAVGIVYARYKFGIFV